MTTAPRDPRSSEAGVALVLCLLFVLALSIVAASLTVLAQTETYASVNYRMMSQARYAAESGVHKAMNYLLNSYTLPGGAGDPLSNYNTTVSPVTYNNQPVVLSATSAVAANYPAAATQTAFSSAAQGTLAAGGISVQYAASATLLSMRQIITYGSGTTTVVQTWRVTADGTITGARTAQVEVSAVLEQQTVPAHTYAAFGTNAGCGSLTFSGGSTSDSYDSTNFTKVNGEVVTQASGGDVGTNGNVTDSGGSTINGALYSPRTGVGSCKNGAVDALTENGGSTVTGGIIELPQAVAYPPPALPSPLPPTTSFNIDASTTCASSGMPAGHCSGSSGNFTFTPNGSALSLGNMTVTAGSTLHLAAGTYNLNSVTLVGGSTLVIDSGPAILNVVGTGNLTPINFAGNSVSNASLDPSKLQLQYAGTGTVSLSGGTAVAAILYAPGAIVNLSGNADFYGSILAATFKNSGGAAIHYDRHLANDFFTVGNPMLSTFTWKKY
jgi:Tfp pilus assembly protein PilX